MFVEARDILGEVVDKNEVSVVPAVHFLVSLAV